MTGPQFEVWCKSFDLRMAAIEKSVKELLEAVGELRGSHNNKTVSLLIKFVVFPLIIILAGIYGITNFIII